MRIGWRWAIGLGVALLAALYVITPVRMDIVMLGDGTTYTKMVEENLWGGYGHMHRYRILVPAIVRWLPLGVDNGFQFVQYVSCLLAALLTYAITRRVVGSTSGALWAVPMYLLTWPTLWNLYQYRTVDAVACVFAAAGVMLALRGAVRAAILVAGIGALAKEAVILIVPLALIAGGRPRTRRDCATLAAAVAAAAMPMLLVRVLVNGSQAFSVVHGEAGTGLLATWRHIRIWLMIQMREVGLWRSFAFIFIPFSALWMLAPLGWARMARGPRRLLTAWILVTMPLVLLGSPERMVEVQAPALIPLAVQALAGVSPWIIALLVAGNALFLLRLVSGIVPFWLAWGALGMAVLAAATVWWRQVAGVGAAELA